MKHSSHSQVFRFRLKQAHKLTSALCHTCKYNTNSYPCTDLAELIHPLVEELEMMEPMVAKTGIAPIFGPMNRYASMLMAMLGGNNKTTKATILPVLLEPILSDLRFLVQVFAKVDSLKAATAADSQGKDASQSEQGADLAEPQPTQEPPISDGQQITTPPENILELLKASLAGKPDDIWAKYQACLPADLTEEEVKIAYDSFMAMFKEYFI